MASNPASLPPLGPLYGALYFAAALSTAFYGVTCVQTFIYYVYYRNDPLRIKIFVAVLCTLNTIHEALIIAGTYKIIMGGLINPLAFLGGAPELVLLFTAMVAIPSQGYLVYRIYIFSGKKIVLPLIYMFLAILELAPVAMFVGKALYTVNGLPIRVVPVTVLANKPFTTLSSLFISVSAAVDILIAIPMTCLLVRSHATTEFLRTAHIFQRLVLLSVNTGISAAIFALLTLILLHVFPKNMLYAVPGIPICAVYCSTTLANLNVRGHLTLEERAATVNMDLFAFQSFPLSETNRNDRRGDMAEVTSPQQGVWTTTEVKVFSDINPSISVKHDTA